MKVNPSIMEEYVRRQPDAKWLREELVRLIKDYNSQRDTFLLVYAAAMAKRNQSIGLEQQDYYMLHDMLSAHSGLKKLDVYIETPGGSGEAAEEIVKLLHSTAHRVTFVVSGEAKSAGTIAVLSGNDILMTDTGSLGPIDAQVRIGRSIVSAHDYKKWVEEKRQEAAQTGALNPFDATMVAQISPGELLGTYNKLSFAEELVTKWLSEYKFAGWTRTEGRGEVVTEEMKRRRATEIAQALCDHSRWKTHGKSIKITDLKDIGLRVGRVDDNPRLAETVYRIQAVLMLLFGSCNSLKMLATADTQVERTEMTPDFQRPRVLPLPGGTAPANVSGVEAELECPKCRTHHQLFAKLLPDARFEAAMQKKGAVPFPRDDIFTCTCGNRINLTGVRKEIESKTGRAIITS